MPSLPLPPTATASRSEGLDQRADDREEIGVGSLGLAAILAVALAALRGTAGAITDWRQRRMAAAAEAAPLRAARAKLQASQMRADAADPSSGGGGRGRVPSSNDYGRRTLGGGGGGGRSTGGGTGRTSGGSFRSAPGSGGTGPSRRSNTNGSGNGTGLSGTLGSGSTARSTGKGAGTGSSSGSGTGASRSGASGGGGGRRPGLLDQLTGRGRRGKDIGSSATGTGSGSGPTGGGKGRSGTGASGAGSGSSTRTTGKGTSSGAGPSTSEDGTGTSKSAGTERVTLGKSLGDEARRRAEERLRRRRENLDPPVLHRVPRNEKGPDSTAPEEPEAAANGPADSGPPPGPPKTETGPHTAGTGSNGPGWEFYEPPGDGGRRDPWDSLFEAEWDAQVVWTVEQVDPPGAHARRWEPDAIAPARAGLPASTPPTATATAGATTPSMTKETRVSAPIPTPRAAGAASEHLTDVTLDDVLASLEKSKTDCFTTYDECASLATLAAELRDGLHALGTELKQRHNVIGRMTGAAMHRLGESMDLLVRKAEEMRTESLHAAEAIELAHDDMHDAYRPVQQATADAGLVMPSARIHNED
ncbi:hypothetical protein [Streptomyces diastaticus]